MRGVDSLLVGLNNFAVKTRRVRVEAKSLLVLLPSCLQGMNCKHNVVGDLKECKRCGTCRIGELLSLCEKLGVRPALARGGHEALQLSKNPAVKAIIAIACPNELRAGILAVMPKPVFAVVNSRPNGPCKQTEVSLEQVEKAIKWLIRT